jgi:putative CocE/NonD family hydrolase
LLSVYGRRGRRSPTTDDEDLTVQHRFLPITLLVVLAATAGHRVSAQGIAYSPISIEDRDIETKIADLAARTLGAPDDADAAARLANRSMLELAAGRYVEAAESLKRAEEAREASSVAPFVPAIAVQIYSNAKAREVNAHESFAAAYEAAFLDALADRDDRLAFDVSYFLGRLPRLIRGDFERTLQRSAGATSLSQPQAVELVRSYVWWQASEQFFPLLSAVIAKDDARRYVVDDGVLVETPDGATVSAYVIRPRSAERLPALLQFTIYAGPTMIDEARETAAHGYAAVAGFSRGKYRSKDPIVPWEHDRVDARALIEWIAHQTWSDGRVGMYGGSYNAAAQWGVAKNPPAALKAMMAPAPALPGIAGPTEGNLFLSYQYRFVPYVASGPMLDEQGYNDMRHWSALDRAWYVSGRPYREMDEIDGKPNPLYRRLLDHPSFDAYWQSMTPQGEEFDRIDIPVLAVTGYYDGAQMGAVHYFTEHMKHNPRADHVLVIGPYQHGAAQHRSEPFVRGYSIDPAATLDVHALRYAWFDHVLKGAPRPALLENRVNFEVMGANVWRHVPSLDAMASEKLRLYFAPDEGGGSAHRLAAAPPSLDCSVDLDVDLADRSDADWLPPYANVIDSLDTHNALTFVTDALPRDTEISGMVSGTFDFEINKRDMDFVIRLYEQLPSGQYLELSQPYVQRASYVRDPSIRHLLVPGARQRLSWVKPAPVSRSVKAGARLVLYVGIQKERDAQVNYGTGKDVSDESIADAGEPLRVRWFGGSFVDFPVAR